MFLIILWGFTTQVSLNLGMVSGSADLRGPRTFFDEHILFRNLLGQILTGLALKIGMKLGFVSSSVDLKGPGNN